LISLGRRRTLRRKLVLNLDHGQRTGRPGRGGQRARHLGHHSALQVLGAHLFLGHVNQPQAIAQAFDPDGRVRPGDAFVSDPDSCLRIFGRFKHKIRQRSENFSAREIEAAVQLRPEAPDCAGQPPERAIEHCRAQLAPFKVPRDLQCVGDLLRTASNKIAKHLLLPANGDLRTGAYDRVMQGLG
jgi:long-chain acyl-CoA synthetase